jgi:hypothetical protein
MARPCGCRRISREMRYAGAGECPHLTRDEGNKVGVPLLAEDGQRQQHSRCCACIVSTFVPTASAAGWRFHKRTVAALPSSATASLQNQDIGTNTRGTQSVHAKEIAGRMIGTGTLLAQGSE